MYEKIADTVVTEPQTVYTSEVNSALNAVKIMYLANPTMTAEEGLQAMKDTIIESNPELTVK